MEKLKELIEQYSRWSILKTYVDRIEAHIFTDFSHSLENAKILLETIAKEICKSKGVTIDRTARINAVLKKAFSAIGYTNSTMVTQISSALATIGQQMGELRNEIGITSHGRSLEEIKERNNKVDETTKDFLIATTVIIASFLIRTFENETTKIKSDPIKNKLLYDENEEFNEFWDNTFGEFTMGDYSYTASEILFNLDYQAYETEYKTLNEIEEGDK